ncbi:MAG: MBL fold metallo-hydrolase [Sandaracinaceae bacterium]|nr:MBL fold metallo-hydrolase [Sandaracinaceae bacterium]
MTTNQNAPVILYEDATHKNVLLPEYGEGVAVQANQHLIIDKGRGMILDPGGHKVYAKVLAETMHQLHGSQASGGFLEHIFLSHQDPDIVAAVNGWLMTTDATAWVSALWVRFVPHFGLDRLVIDRLKPISDEGGFLKLGDTELMLVPAHFLHSPGNFQVYDPRAKILYTGDLGASIGREYREVKDFDDHLPAMDGFHRRYMGSRSMMTAWVKMVRQLDIECLAPQHGACFRGKAMVERFYQWAESFDCGVDVMAGKLALPSH